MSKTILMVAAVLPLCNLTAQAAPISVTLSQSTGSGDAILIQASFDDTVVAGQIHVTLSVIDNPAVAGTGIGDLRGFFFHTTPDTATFLSGLTVAGADLTQVEISRNNVNNLGGGNSINPLGPFDVGVEIGTSGIGSDDIQSTSLVIAHNLQMLDNSLFDLTTNFLAVRATSVGTSDNRGSSGKYGTIVDILAPGDPPPPPAPIPEPATVAILGLMALCGAGHALRRRFRS